MSTDALEELRRKVGASPALQADADAAYEKLSADVSNAHAAYFEHMVEIGKQHGCDFTVEEAATQFQGEVDQLSDEDVRGFGFDMSSTFSTSTFSTGRDFSRPSLSRRNALT